jgi:uncharacterized protein (TIGR03437 family)
VGGWPAHILFISPGQVNIQAPISYPSGPTAVVVSTPLGVSDPFSTEAVGPDFGVFTLDSSGCGPGAVLNVGKDGGLTLNSPSNPASPGDFIAIYGTGLTAAKDAAAGVPAHSNPQAAIDAYWNHYAEFGSYPEARQILSRPSFAGRAPGLVGVDQLNFQIPENAPEGCAVQMTIGYLGTFLSQPTPISIRRGGGACVDPPSASYGQLLWQKTAGGADPAEEIETFTAVLVAAPGLRTPALVYQDGRVHGPTIEYAGPCPPPEQRTLDVGGITLEGPGFGPLPAVATVLNRRTVIRADLPRGTIRAGLFKVRATGGADVGPFESSVQIGSPIQVTTPIPPGTVFSPLRAMTVTWTGGAEDAWVTLRVMAHRGSLDRYTATYTRASAGRITLGRDGSFLPAPHGSGLECNGPQILDRK